MPGLLDLPRELRDMVYLAILTNEERMPDPRALLHTLAGWKPEREKKPYTWNPAPLPTTCANFLVSSRQIYEEMSDAISLATKQELTSAKLDCVVLRKKTHHFTWVRIPFVKTMQLEKSEEVRSWIKTMVSRWRIWNWNTPYAYHGAANQGSSRFRTETQIHQLWMDIRLFDRNPIWSPSTPYLYPTPWAICDALKHILTAGPDFSPTSSPYTTTSTSIDELVLNVSKWTHAPTTRATTQTSSTTSDPPYGVWNAMHARTVADQLVDMWNSIWAGHGDGKYLVLLERVKKVRVCVEGETVKVREIRGELERGRAERKRSEARLGYLR